VKSLDQLSPREFAKFAVALVAMTIALYKGFKGRAKWEPSIEVVPKASQRWAFLASLVLIVLVMFFFSDQSRSTIVAVIMVIAFLAGFFAYRDYHHLISARIYDQPVIRDGFRSTINILVGGSEDLKPEAKTHLQQNPNDTIQNLINGCGGDLESLWSKDVLANVKFRYETAYIAMVTGGTLALGCAGILGSRVFRH
jgi:hypothetical protein